MICSTVTEKLDRELFSTITLFTVFQTFPAGLNVTSRWPDTSDFHSPISALVPRPKFMTPSWVGVCVCVGGWWEGGGATLFLT